MEGNVLSETDSEVRIEVSNSAKTIVSTRVIPRTDIRSIQRENPDQKKQGESFEKLAKFQLDPNQELTSDQYAKGIAAFDKFLAKYPNSSFAEDINDRIADWRAEASNVESGKVKFANKWMTPEEKRVRAEHWQKQMAVQSAQNALQLLKKQLADLQARRGQLAEDLGAAQGNLAATQAKTNTLHDVKVPIYVTDTRNRSDNSRHGGSVQVSSSTRVAGYNRVPSPELEQAQNDIAHYSQQVGQGRAALETIDANIRDIQSQIPKAEQDYRQALVRFSEPVQAK